MSTRKSITVPVADGWAAVDLLPPGTKGICHYIEMRLHTTSGPGVTSARAVASDRLDKADLELLAHAANPDDLDLLWDVTGVTMSASATDQVDLGTWPGDFHFDNGLTIGVDFTKSNANAGSLLVQVTWTLE